jgi:hypothetical protein
MLKELLTYSSTSYEFLHIAYPHKNSSSNNQKWQLGPVGVIKLELLGPLLIPLKMKAQYAFHITRCTIIHTLLFS